MNATSPPAVVLARDDPEDEPEPSPETDLGWMISADCAWPEPLKIALEQAGARIWAYFTTHYPQFPVHACVELHLSSDATVRRLNRQWRGKNAPTNVLSFPAARNTAAPPDTPVMVGTVIFARETMECEAKELNIFTQEHATHLMIHGLLHLLGHDHQRDAERIEMERWEISALQALGLASPYPETLS